MAGGLVALTPISNSETEACLIPSLSRKGGVVCGAGTFLPSFPYRRLCLRCGALQTVGCTAEKEGDFPGAGTGSGPEWDAGRVVRHPSSCAKCLGVLHRKPQWVMCPRWVPRHLPLGWRRQLTAAAVPSRGRALRPRHLLPTFLTSASACFSPLRSAHVLHGGGW